MSGVSIYIESIELENIRTFQCNSKLKFTREDNTVYQWTLILGDNGIGKSTILQSIAWMKPDLQDATNIGMFIKKSDVEPLINSESNYILEGLVNRGVSQPKDKVAKLLGRFKVGEFRSDGQKVVKKLWCTTKMKIEVTDKYKLKDVFHEFDTNNKKTFIENSINIFGYSASRVLGSTNISDTSLSNSIGAFLKDKTVLYDAQQILHTINYAAMGQQDSKEKKKYQNYLKVVKEALIGLLPDFENVKDIDVSSPRMVDNVLEEGSIYISTKHGDKIPFSNFSLGYKTVMSWVVDLTWRLFNAYPASKTPLLEHAIVLIDELDLHLHPIWQRDIMKHLSAHFPKVQFIATAHSPLMVQAAINDNYAVLNFDQDENSVRLFDDIKSIDGWRIDQILTSDFFGLKTSRGIEYEEMQIRRESLVRKTKLSGKEKKELSDLTAKMSNYPVGETTDEIENRKLIAETVKKIKEKKIKIEL